MVNSRKYKENGFTIIELMIATTIFSLILLLCMAAIMQITRLYYRGVTQASTQEAARAIADEFSQAIQFSNSSIYYPTGDDANPTGPDIDDGDDSIGFVCIGGKRYTYHIDRQVVSGEPDASNKQVSAGLIVDTPKADDGRQLGCAGAVEVEELDITNTDDISATSGTELLDNNMRLLKLNIEPAITDSSSIWRIDVAVAYGDDDLFDDEIIDGQKKCKPSGPGIEFCAVSEISTTVRRRVE